MTKDKDVCVVVGAQFGSEGKGAVLGRIGGEYRHHVRVGAANAGHTLYTEKEHGDGTATMEKHVLQQVPCGAYANPHAELYIGPGALISPDILLKELRLLDEWRMDRGLDPKVIHVDHRAHVITQEQIDREYGGDLAARIGSTSATAAEGIGTAQADRVMRDADCVLALDYFVGRRWDCVDLANVPALLAEAKGGVLLEGTQGTGLSLTTGYFPYVTSRNTAAAGLCADCGVAPTRIEQVIVVARTYPIRVAGNSGPFYPDSEEIAWEDIDVDSENERTTVTKKVRRVATLSYSQLKDACDINGASEIALMFGDYVDPSIAGGSCPHASGVDFASRAPELGTMIAAIEAVTGVPVFLVGTGPHSFVECVA